MDPSIGTTLDPLGNNQTLNANRMDSSSDFPGLGGGAETVYDSSPHYDMGQSFYESSSGMPPVPDSGNGVMSDKVQTLAGSIYREFERMIQRYDEDVVKTLMPLLVNVLECLDAQYQLNQEHDVELELVREDNEQLVTQYERERERRRAAEQKQLELEDSFDMERKELVTRLETLESIARMLELKHKNATEHAGRLEDRESELKKEYAKLHDRYTELFKTHMDYMERTKLLLSGGQLANDANGGSITANRGQISRLNTGRSSGPVSFGFTSLEGVEPMEDIEGSGATSPGGSSLRSSGSESDLHSGTSKEPSGFISPAKPVTGFATTALMMEKAQETDSVRVETKGTAITPSTPPENAQPPKVGQPGRSQTKREQRSANTLYQELSYQDSDALADMDEGADITGGWVHPGEYASSVNDNFFGMGKEVENLIMENNELLATKNALNIVKDDLIVKVDELTSELEMVREQLHSLHHARDTLRTRVTELEEELKRLREENATAIVEANEKAKDDESDVPMAQRKRFTRVEMARVLMERNQYKERLMDLQEAVHWAELVRANRMKNANMDGERLSRPQSIFKYFSNLLSGSSSKMSKGESSSSATEVIPQLTYNPATNRVLPGTIVRSLPRDEGQNSRQRRDQYRTVRAHVRKDDGRMHAYGWSLPSKPPQQSTTTIAITSAPTSTQGRSGSGVGVSVPVPVYCQPIQLPTIPTTTPTDEPGRLIDDTLGECTYSSRLWCATGIDLTGGVTKDGGVMVGASVFYKDVLDGNEKSKTTAGVKNDENTSKSSDSNTMADVTDASTPLGPPMTAQIGELERLEDDVEQIRQAMTSEHRLSSFVWLVSVTEISPANVTIIDNGTCKKVSTITILDANRPGDVLESFHIPGEQILCVTSVRGVILKDYGNTSDISFSNTNKNENENESSNEDNKEGEITYVSEPISVSCPILRNEYINKHNLVTKVPDKKSSISTKASNVSSQKINSGNNQRNVKTEEKNNKRVGFKEEIEFVDDEIENESSRSDLTEPESEVNGNLKMADGEKSEKNSVITEIKRRKDDSNENHMSSAMATVWLGSQSGSLYVHSAQPGHTSECLHSVRLPDAVLAIVHVGSRVVAALANGCVAVFRRHPQTGQWLVGNNCTEDTSSTNTVHCGFHLVRLAPPQHSVCCAVGVVTTNDAGGEKAWLGVRNRLHVLDPHTLRVVHAVNAHPRPESQVRQLAWLGEGVWVSIRLDSTLRLYHAHTYQHLQDVDIEPYVGKMLGAGKVGFSYVRITSLLISSQRLWIGTSNGVIISVPLNYDSQNFIKHSYEVSKQVSEALRQNLEASRQLAEGLEMFSCKNINEGQINTVKNSSDHSADSKNKNESKGVNAEVSSTEKNVIKSDSSADNSLQVVEKGNGVTGNSNNANSSLRTLQSAKNEINKNLIPFCSMSQAQLSFHGHRDAVKFFVAVPGKGGSSYATENVKQENPTMLVLSGGEGYIDFRIGDGEMEDSVVLEEVDDQNHQQNDSHELLQNRSHLIVWQVMCPQLQQ